MLTQLKTNEMYRGKVVMFTPETERDVTRLKALNDRVKLWLSGKLQTEIETIKEYLQRGEKITKCRYFKPKETEQVVVITYEV